MTEFALHNFAHGFLPFLEAVENEAETGAIFRVILKDFESNLRQNAERTFAAHHNLIDVRAAGFARDYIGFKFTDRSNVFLTDDYVFDLP